MVSAITNIITYSYLYEFGLTQSNIIFNTGGGALLLLPKCKNFEEKLNKVTQKVQEILLDKFSVDINYVYAWVECDRKELETFKISKATKLKSKLDEEKNRKFNKVLNSDFSLTNQSQIMYVRCVEQILWKKKMIHVISVRR